MAAPVVNNHVYGTPAQTGSPFVLSSYTVSSGGSNKILIVSVGVEDDTLVINSVSYGSDTLTKAAGLKAGTYQQTEVWYKINPTVQTANVSIAYTGASFHRGLISACYLTDAKQTDVPDATDTTAGGAGGTQIDVTTTVDDCLMWGAWSSNLDLTTTGPGDTFHARHTGNSLDLQTGYSVVETAGTESMKIVCTIARCVAIGVAFRPLAGSVASGAGSASGTSTVSGVGESTFAAAGASSGTSTASAVGQATAAAAGASSGTSTASAVGQGVAAADGASSGTSTASAVGQATAAADGASSGTATASAFASGTSTASGSSSGTATASAVGRASIRAEASSSGTSTASAVGQTIGSGAGSASGTATASGVGALVSAAIAAAGGTAIVSGISPVTVAGFIVIQSASIATGQAVGTINTGQANGTILA